MLNKRISYPNRARALSSSIFKNPLAFFSLLRCLPWAWSKGRKSWSEVIGRRLSAKGGRSGVWRKFQLCFSFFKNPLFYFFHNCIGIQLTEAILLLPETWIFSMFGARPASHFRFKHFWISPLWEITEFTHRRAKYGQHVRAGAFGQMQHKRIVG